MLNKCKYIYSTIVSDMSSSGIYINDIIKNNSKILEYGAGSGEVSYHFATEFPKAKVLGVDVHNSFEGVYVRAQVAYGDHSPPSNLSFSNIGPDSEKKYIISMVDPLQVDSDAIGLDEYTFCYSWCVFEHIDIRTLDDAVKSIFNSLKSGGILYIKINPLYYSVRGSHLHSIVEEPWAHLIYDTHTLRQKAFKKVRVTGVKATEAMWHQFETLNRITGSDLVDALKKGGFNILHEDRKYEGRAPKHLLNTYNEEALRNKEITLICSKK